MEIVVFLLYSNKKLLIYHFHQETNSIVHLVEIVMFDVFLMFKIGCMLNVIYCNKLCVAWCSVWHRTTTVDLVILMWITSCKISWVFTVNFMISSTVMWACYKSHWKSNFSGTKSSTAFSLHWWMTLHVLIQKIHYSLTSCQLHFPVPLSSFLAHLLALSHIINPF